MNINIRIESAADLAAIEAVTAAAFLSAPHTTHTEHLIVNALREAEQLSISLVATLDSALIGHVAVSPVSISDAAGGWFGLGPLSVLPQHQRCGVGSRLVVDALRILRHQASAGCVVLGNPEFCGRFGFRAQPRLILPGVPPAYFQAVCFDSSWPSGIVSYSAAFNG